MKGGVGEVNKPARLSRAESAARTRQRLLVVAGDLFEEHGYHGVTIGAIVDQAGFTRGAFYAHFTDKADVFLTLLESTQQSELGRIRDTLTEESTYAAAQAGFESMSLDTRWRLATVEFWPLAVRDPQLKERWLARMNAVRSIIVLMLQRYVDDNQITLPLPVDQVAALILATAEGISTQSTLDPTPFPADAFATAVMYLWVGLTSS